MGLIETDLVAAAKELRALARKLGDAELCAKAEELENGVVDAGRELREKNEKIDELERALEFKIKAVFRSNAYWISDDPSPFCAGCFDSKHQRIRLQRNDVHRFQCPQCRCMVYTEEFERDDRVRPIRIVGHG